MLRLLTTTLLALILLSLSSCQQKSKTEVTPWGATVTTDADGNVSYDEETDTAQSDKDGFSLKDIVQGGEMIMLTLSGPETYYDYHGRGMGVHYLLCEKLADHLGVTLRVDVCRDTLDMLQRLRNGEGDIIAFPVSKQHQKGFTVCGDSWIVNSRNAELAKAVRKWHKPNMLAEMKKQEEYILSVASVTRRINPLMLSAKAGKISQYDILFRRYAAVAGMDWVLMAAQCYQESCFDPKAHSWAGACGLMQIIPSTADHLSLPRNMMYEPEPNIAAAARYMKELQGLFSDVKDPMERIKFALASYNGGHFHIRDAMALTAAHGGNPKRWNDVRRYVLALSQPEFYRAPQVKNGYMRGSETANYVDMIIQRWQQYRVALSTGTPIVSSVPKKASSSAPSAPSITAQPHHAAKANKWRKD